MMAKGKFINKKAPITTMTIKYSKEKSDVVYYMEKAKSAHPSNVTTIKT